LPLALCEKKGTGVLWEKGQRVREAKLSSATNALLAALATRLWGNANRRVKHNTESHRPWQHGLFVRLIREYAAKLVSATFCRSQNAAETGNWLLQKLALVYRKFWHVATREQEILASYFRQIPHGWRLKSSWYRRKVNKPSLKRGIFSKSDFVLFLFVNTFKTRFLFKFIM
jgi:hypothetical protein